MSFRTRLTLAAAAAVAVAVVAASAITYALVRNELRSQVDETLQRARRGACRARIVGDPQGGQFLGFRRSGSAASPSSPSSSSSDGKAITAAGTRRRAPRVGEARAAAARGEIDEPFYEDARVEGTHVRVLTIPLGERGYARPGRAGRSRRSTTHPRADPRAS